MRKLNSRGISRRTLLRSSTGLVTLGLPVLDAMLNDAGNALADGNALPLIFGTFYWGGGVVARHWVPSTQGQWGQLPATLEPFDGLQSKLTLVTGVNHSHADPGHIPARGIALSSSHDLTWVQDVDVGKGFRGQNHPEPTIDAIVAEAWKGTALFDSLHIGICRKGPYKSNSSWQRGGQQYNRHEPSPERLWRRLFGQPSASAIATQASVLDAVRTDAASLAKRLGGTDRQRLEAHLDGIRNMERRLQERRGSGKLAASCPRITAMDGLVRAPDAKPLSEEQRLMLLRSQFFDGTGKDEKQAKSELMSDILALSLACGMTRVFSYEWSATQSHAIYWETGARMEHHPMNHAMGESDHYERTIHFIMKNFAYLARSLQRFREGQGSLLDRTLIVGTSEHASARKHNWKDHPLLLIGGAGGNLRAGQHIRHPDPLNNFAAPEVLLAAVRAVNVFAPYLGQQHVRSDRRATRPLPGLLV